MERCYLDMAPTIEPTLKSRLALVSSRSCEISFKSKCKSPVKYTLPRPLFLE